MATLLKRKYISKNNQEQLFQVFYDNFRSDKDSFLWHRFIDEDDNDVESGTNLEEESVREDTDTALESIVDGAADTDNEALIEVLSGDHIAENEDRDGNEPADEVENQLPIEQPKKQKFKNLDQVLNEDKYCDLLAQRKRFWKYADAKKPIKIKWWTVPHESPLQPRGAKNIMRNRHAPEGLNKRWKPRWSCSNCFLPTKCWRKLCFTPITLSIFCPLEERDKDLHFKRLARRYFSIHWPTLSPNSISCQYARHPRYLGPQKLKQHFYCNSIVFNRFQFIHKFIMFDNKPTCNDRWKSGKYACLHELLEMMNGEMQSIDFHHLCSLLMKLSTHTVELLDSSNTTSRSQQSMVCYIVAFVILLYPPLISCWSMPENYRSLLLVPQSISYEVQTSTPSTL